MRLTQDLYVEYKKNSQNLIIKKQMALLENDKRHLIEEEIQIENKHVKRFLPSLAITEIQIKTTVEDHSIRTAKKKKK